MCGAKQVSGVYIPVRNSYIFFGISEPENTYRENSDPRFRGKNPLLLAGYLWLDGRVSGHVRCGRRGCRRDIREAHVNKRKTGSRYEVLAARYLEKKGYLILRQNFRCRAGEIDLIARDQTEGQECLVFTEVKYRKNGAAGLPEEAVNANKRRRISRAADYFRVQYRIPMDVPCRFDVIAIEGERLRHHINAFEYETQKRY